MDSHVDAPEIKPPCSSTRRLVRRPLVERIHDYEPPGFDYRMGHNRVALITICVGENIEKREVESRDASSEQVAFYPQPVSAVGSRHQNPSQLRHKDSRKTS